LGDFIEVIWHYAQSTRFHGHTVVDLINLAQRPATLVVDGPSEQAPYFFRDGKLAYARVGQEDGSLATVLHKANKLTVNQYRAIVERAGNITDKELGLLLNKCGVSFPGRIPCKSPGIFYRSCPTLCLRGEGSSVLKAR